MKVYNSVYSVGLSSVLLQHVALYLTGLLSEISTVMRDK